MRCSWAYTKVSDLEDLVVGDREFTRVGPMEGSTDSGWRLVAWWMSDMLILRWLRAATQRSSLERLKIESEVQREFRSGDGDMGLISTCEQTRSLRERNEKWEEMRAEDQSPEEHCQLGIHDGCCWLGARESQEKWGSRKLRSAGSQGTVSWGVRWRYPSATGFSHGKVMASSAR